MNWRICRPYAGLILILAGCTGSIKDKLTHKWRVVSAGYYDEAVNHTQDLYTIEQWKEEDRVTRILYTGAVYDLQNNGTVSFSSAAEKSAGTWELEENTVNMKKQDGTHERWYFLGGKPMIYADSSIKVNVNANTGKYIMLELKPAAGEQVKPDY